MVQAVEEVEDQDGVSLIKNIEHVSGFMNLVHFVVYLWKTIYRNYTRLL